MDDNYCLAPSVVSCCVTLLCMLNYVSYCKFNEMNVMHIFGKQTGYIFQSPKAIKTWTTKHYASLNQWYNTE